MAKNIINEIKRIRCTNKTYLKIDDDVTIVLSDKSKDKFRLYLRSIIASINLYAGEDYKEEYAYVYSRCMSTYNEIPCKLHIEMIGYKDEKYILIKFILTSTKLGVTPSNKTVFLDIKEADKLLANINI